MLKTFGEANKIILQSIRSVLIKTELHFKRKNAIFAWLSGHQLSNLYILKY